MDLLPTLTQACRQGRLLVLWGALPFPLVARSPANRALALNQWAAEAEALPLPSLPLFQLPPLPLLSLDPTGRVERAFVQAGVPLQVVHTRYDVPTYSRHTLLQLAGDLETRSGVVLSHSEVRELRGDPDKRHLLDEACRLVEGGALLLLGCDPASADFRAWWSVLAPALGGAAFFALGEPTAAWPQGVTCLGPDFEALNAALWAAQPEPGAVEPIASPQPPAQFDVCIFCALAEEAKAVIAIFSRRCGVEFEPGRQRTGRAYQQTTITNKGGEPLTVLLSWPPAYGPLEAALFIRPVLEEFRPRFAAMTGICAGDKRKVKLGDIVVAERAFTYDSGKVVLDKRGRRRHRHDANPRQPDPDVLQFVRMFDGWQEAVGGLPRPPSKRQQRDWLLKTLLEPSTPRVDEIKPADLETHAPAWRQIVAELQAGSAPYLTTERGLRDQERVKELQFGPEEFPFKDPPQATCHIAPLASGSAVRSDNPFDEVQVPVRGTVAIDMEGAAFYRTVAEFPGISSLLVKGVCDYADRDKDDSYHWYAAQASAAYMLCLIQDYVTTG
jgi:nucleoside phosphorylase